MTDYVFDPKTGELSRGGRLLPLARLHAQMFEFLRSQSSPVSRRAIAHAIQQPTHSIEIEMPTFRARLARLCIRVASNYSDANRERGYILAFDPMPKWQPTIPPAVTIEGGAT